MANRNALLDRSYRVDTILVANLSHLAVMNCGEPELNVQNAVASRRENERKKGTTGTIIN